MTGSNHPIDDGSVHDYNLKVLENIKPVLRKQTIHNAKNVVLLFKSVEIQLVKQTINTETGKLDFKFLSPLYVPLHHLESYMNLDKSQFEIQLLKSIYEKSPGHFIFVDEKDLKQTLANNPHLSQILVGNKNIGVRKKDDKSYAPKVLMSRLGIKKTDSKNQIE